MFKDLPRYPRSDDMSALTKSTDGTFAESFTVPGATPATILQYFVDVLPRDGWTAVSAPTADGTVSRRGVWQRSHRRLVVSSAPAPTAGATASQYSFVLAPAGTGTP